jgi:hypothetical protein
MPGSPCIDAGCNYGVARDEFDIDEDGDTSEFVPFDLDGAPRTMNDPATADTGCGIAPIVDIGAYEFAGDTGFPPCMGDLNGDRQIDLADLGVLLAWYEAGFGGDLNCDGQTNLEDLGEVLAVYGEPCD